MLVTFRFSSGMPPPGGSSPEKYRLWNPDYIRSPIIVSGILSLWDSRWWLVTETDQLFCCTFRETCLLPFSCCRSHSFLIVPSWLCVMNFPVITWISFFSVTGSVSYVRTKSSWLASAEKSKSTMVSWNGFPVFFCRDFVIVIQIGAIHRAINCSFGIMD